MNEELDSIATSVDYVGTRHIASCLVCDPATADRWMPVGFDYGFCRANLATGGPPAAVDDNCAVIDDSIKRCG